MPGLHKVNGLRLLQQRWDISSDEVLAFGDGGNDLEMLVQSRFSFAMQNAPQVKDAARYGAPSNNRGRTAGDRADAGGERPFAG